MPEDEQPPKEMPNPTPEQLDDPVFNAIWNVIKTWDVNVPEYYQGYCGANGSHVMLILNALKEVVKQQYEISPLTGQLHRAVEDKDDE